MDITHIGRRLAALVTPFLVGSVALASGLYDGAVWTSSYDGTIPNQNIYENKSDVYLNGGPQNLNANGLPDGHYYFQVTDPSGKYLLSTDSAYDRVLQVVSGRIYGHVAPGTHADGLLDTNNNSIPVQLIPFADTPNNGGEYKVWLIPVELATPYPSSGPPKDRFRFLEFNRNDAKTDNFKVLRKTPRVNTELYGTKFYDADADGQFDEDEVGIGGFRINVFVDYPNDDPDAGFVLWDPNSLGYTTETLPDGTWSVLDLPGDVVIKVCEIMPQTGDDCVWKQTYPTPGYGADNGLLSDGDGCWIGDTRRNGNLIVGLDFGNVCVCPLYGGHTKGYWHTYSNPGNGIMGQDRATQADFDYLNANFCLWRLDGTEFVADINNWADWSTWLTSDSNGSNMANMLSIQLTALVMTTLHFGDAGFNEDLNADTVVILTSNQSLADCWNEHFAADPNVYETMTTVGHIIEIAQAMLCDQSLWVDGKLIIESGHPDHAKFACIKSIIDAINNNQFYGSHDGVCNVIYPE